MYLYVCACVCNRLRLALCPCLYVIGFKTEGPLSSTLLEVELDVITIAECQTKVVTLPPNPENVLCALTLFKDTCQVRFIDVHFPSLYVIFLLNVLSLLFEIKCINIIIF